MVMLSECCTLLTDGNWIESKDQSDSGIRLVQTGNIGNGVYLEKESRAKYISQETFERLKCTEVFPGDILVSRLPDPVGRACIIPKKSERMVTAVDCSILRVDKSVVDVEYLQFFLRSKRYFNQLSAKLAGTTRTRISRKNLEKVTLSIPSKDIQKAIVNTLNHLMLCIRIRERELQLLDELIKARFVELFGSGRDGKCNAVMISDICKFQQGTQIPVELQKVEYKEGYKRFLRIIDYTQAPQPPRFVNVEGKEIDDKSVVVVRYGATAGFVGRGYSGILANNLFEVVPDESIISKAFLYLALKYGTFERDIHEKAFGAAMPALSFSMLNDIPIVVPNLLSQELFVRFYEQVDKSKAAVRRSLDENQKLFDSLMQQYFG